MNVENIRKAIAYLQEEPRRARMEVGIAGYDRFKRLEDGIRELDRPPCGTVFCIAGAGAILAGQKLPGNGGLISWEVIMQDACTFFQLDRLAAERLFYLPGWNDDALDDMSGCWPKNFEREYVFAKTPEQRVDVMARRAEHFIATEGRE